jgi:hypothetical protein
MSLNLRKLEEKAGSKAREKHGIIGFLNTGKLPSGRAWKRAQEEVSELRLALIAQFGGPAIKPAVLALVESAIEGLMIQRLASLYVKKAGILRRDSLKDGNLELHSILSGQFISYANLVRLNLESAARLAKDAQAEHGPSALEIAAEIDAEKALEGPRNAPERRTPEDKAADTEEL